MKTRSYCVFCSGQLDDREDVLGKTQHGPFAHRACVEANKQSVSEQPAPEHSDVEVLKKGLDAIKVIEDAGHSDRERLRSALKGNVLAIERNAQLLVKVGELEALLEAKNAVIEQYSTHTSQVEGRVRQLEDALDDASGWRKLDWIIIFGLGFPYVTYGLAWLVRAVRWFFS